MVRLQDLSQSSRAMMRGFEALAGRLGKRGPRTPPSRLEPVAILWALEMLAWALSALPLACCVDSSLNLSDPVSSFVQWG